MNDSDPDSDSDYGVSISTFYFETVNKVEKVYLKDTHYSSTNKVLVVRSQP